MSKSDKRFLKLNKLNGELLSLTDQPTLFEMTRTQKEAWNKKVKKLTEEIKKLETELAEIKSNKIYENGFEWRFEFPEVLNNDGDFTGVDVVIGNPPYIRSEALGSLKVHLKQYFKIYIPAGDIFSYFYELSYTILNEGGIFCFINNTFDKTSAGKALRQFVFKNFCLEQYIDFTSVEVFEEATTYPIILLANKGSNLDNTFKYIKIDENQYKNKEHLFLDSCFTQISQIDLGLDVWNFKNEIENNLLLKLKSFKSLFDLYGKSYRGIITGLNEAFIVKKNLPNITEVKPVYEGKDIKKWGTPSPTKWIIVFKNKSSKQKFGDLDFEAIKAKMMVLYPELFDHLNHFEEDGKKRFDKGEYWWELRNCAYYSLFSKPKIIFPNLQNTNKFAFDESGTYINAPAVFFPTNDKYLLSILNSKIVWYFLKSICVVRSGGFIEVKPQYFEQIPIPELTEEIKSLLTDKADQIISLKKSDPSAETSALEAEIDRLVYELYGLTEEEIRIVEGVME